MTDAVAHRGPDGEGGLVLDCDGQPPTGLGHRRLAIIDLSDAGLQPMKLSCAELKRDELVLVFNGEIYNYRELRAQLAAQGHRFASASDSEVLLHLYEADGPAMLSRLNGIFAFAIYDGRERGRPDGVERGAMFIARDPLGVKPLYFVDSPTGFLFASEIKALLLEATVDRTIDVAALHQTLAYLWTPAPRTILRAVRKLEPGSALIVSRGRIQKKWSYYTPPYGQTFTASEGDLANELADRLYAAVDRQLVSDVPVGAFLSGGLDSSSVVAMMRRARPSQEIQTFTIGFEDEADTDGNPPDIPFARKVARHLDVSMKEITLPAHAIRRLGEMIRLLDEPQADPAPINALIIAEASRAMGIPVLLSGAGGDDIFGGYRRHWALQFERNWAWLPGAVRERMQVAAQWAASGNGRGQSVPAVRRLAKMFAYAGESDDRRLVSYFLWSTDGLRRGLYTPEFARETESLDAGEPLLQTLERIPKGQDRLQQMLLLDTVHFLADHNLNYTDRAGMAVGVEVRVPLLDLELVEFAARLPTSMKQAGRVGKPLFKKAMEPYLPHDVIYRPKTGFGAPLRRWLRTELRDLVQDTLSPTALRRRGFFEPNAVARLIDEDQRGKVDGSYTIFALLSFELWCRSFLDAVPQDHLRSVA
jgi:asparagine synthase (glutamine-hydrolysing)